MWAAHLPLIRLSRIVLGLWVLDKSGLLLEQDVIEDRPGKELLEIFEDFP